MNSLQRCLGPQVKPEYVYTDGGKEFEKAFKELNFLADTSTPHRSETNGVAERAARRVKEGTSCALYQSGWHTEWWPEAMMCYCFLRNVQDILTDGKTAYRKRFDTDYKAPKYPSVHRASTHRRQTKTALSSTNLEPRSYQASSWDITRRPEDHGAAIC